MAHNDAVFPSEPNAKFEIMDREQIVSQVVPALTHQLDEIGTYPTLHPDVWADGDKMSDFSQVIDLIKSGATAGEVADFIMAKFTLVGTFSDKFYIGPWFV